MFNRSDIVLFDRIDFYQSIYDKTELEQPYSSYFLNKSDLSHHSFQNIQSSTPILPSTKNSLSMEYLKKQSKMTFLHQGYNSSDLQKEYLEKVKIEPSIEKLINFEKSTISKNYELENSIHFNLYSKNTNNKENIQVINFNDLNLGDAVVHHKHGIGRFISIDRLDIAQRKREFVRLIYRNNDKLLLPIENLNLISRYGFDDNNLILDNWAQMIGHFEKQLLKRKLNFLLIS